MNNATITEITDRARAVLALDEELQCIEAEKNALEANYRATLANLLARRSACQDAIQKLGGSNEPARYTECL